MPIADIAIAIVIVISVGIAFVRGFVKEALSIISLLLAIWAAFNFGAAAGTFADNWLSSPDLQAWFGRVLVFIVVLTLGGLMSWAVSKLVRLSVLSGTDRILGMFFGFARAIVLVALFAMGGQYANFDNDEWWDESVLLPYGELVADWLLVMAPIGIDLLQPGLEIQPDLPVDLPLPDKT